MENPEILNGNQMVRAIPFVEPQKTCAVQLIWIFIVAGRSPTTSNFIVFFFLFLHTISSRLVCVNGKHPGPGLGISCQWNLHSGFHSLGEFHIPKPRIPDSTSKESPDYLYMGRNMTSQIARGSHAWFTQKEVIYISKTKGKSWQKQAPDKSS